MLWQFDLEIQRFLLKFFAQNEYFFQLKYFLKVFFLKTIKDVNHTHYKT